MVLSVIVFCMLTGYNFLPNVKQEQDSGVKIVFAP
jgi:hypothetical protein